MLTIVFMTTKEVMVGVAMEVGLKILANLPFKMMEKLLMVIGEVDIGIRPYPLPPIIKSILLHLWVFLLMFMIEVDIGIIPANYVHIPKDVTRSTISYFSPC